MARDSKKRFQEWVCERTPWFSQPIKQIDWLVDLPYRERLASRFGENRCWLIGDAAHECHPFGFHSMNAGLSEAAELADTLKSILRDGASPELLDAYGKNRRDLAMLARQLGLEVGAQEPARHAQD